MHDILHQVRLAGDAASLNIVTALTAATWLAMESFCLSAEHLHAALDTIAPETREALEIAAAEFVTTTATSCRSPGSIKRPTALYWVSK